MTIFTPEGKALAPLTIEYPIEQGGKDFWTVLHVGSSGIAFKDLVRSGQSYVRNMLDLAAKRLREKAWRFRRCRGCSGAFLCRRARRPRRFRAEKSGSGALRGDYSLFASTSLDTYRYSVLSAGASGMVQMIPWAYNSSVRDIRRWSHS